MSRRKKTEEAAEGEGIQAAQPEATITSVRKRNARGDQRHPHAGGPRQGPAGAD